MEYEVAGASWFRSAAGTPAIWMVVVGFALSIPIWLHDGEVALGADLIHHLLWSENFSRQFWNGDLYPRWLEDMNGGLGSPTFFFYPPLPYYVSAMFYPLTWLGASPWVGIAATASIAIVASGFAARAWLRSFTTDGAAAVGAFFYMAMPYHLGADLYVRFGFASLWGFAWMPLVLRSAVLPQQGTSSTDAIRAVIGTAIPYALLAISHLPTLLIFSALPMLQAAVLSASGRRIQGVVCCLAGLALGTGMAAVFVLPAWADQPWVSIQGIATGWASYTNHFLLDPERAFPNTDVDWFERGMDLWACLVLAFSAYATLYFLRRQGGLSRRELFWIVIATGSVLITTPLAGPVWRYLPMLNVVQFPWRFGAISTLAVVALTAMMLDRAGTHAASLASLLRQYLGGWQTPALLALSVLAFAALVVAYRSRMVWCPIPWFAAGVVAIALVAICTYGFAGRQSSERRMMLGAWLVGCCLLAANIPFTIPQISWQLDSIRGVAHPPYDDLRRELAASFDPPEYRIATVAPQNYTPSHMLTLHAAAPPVAMTSGTGRVQLVRSLARRETLEVNAETPISVVVRRYFYPGTVIQDSSGTRLGSVTASAGEGLVQADLPAGNYRLDLVLAQSVSENVGMLISIVSITLCGALLLYGRALRTKAK